MKPTRPPVILYKWRIRHKPTARWRQLRWMMTEEQAAAWAAKEGVEIEMVEGSREEHYDVDGRY